MAIYHCSVKIISRNKGRSVVGAAAYRAGHILYNKYDGLTHDYTRKDGVTYTDIILPQNAPKQYRDRETLWNAVEGFEKGKDAQLAREVEVALPKELNQADHIRLVQQYVQQTFVEKGMCADIAIHDKGDGNPHAHILLTVRPLNEQGEWGAKQEKLYLMAKEGETEIYCNATLAKEKEQDGFSKVKRENGKYKTRSVDLTGWNSKDALMEYRQSWAEQVNLQLRDKNIEKTIDHRSYKDQEIFVEPTIHLGSVASRMEKRGVHSDRGNINREIQKDNLEFLSNLTEMGNLIEEHNREKNQQNTFDEKESLDKLMQLRNKFFSLEQELFNVNELEKKIEQEYDRLSERQMDLKAKKQLFNYQESVLKELHQEKNNLGLLKIKERKKVNEKIKNMSEKQSDLIEIIQQRFNIEPKQMDEEIQKLSQEKERVWKQNRNINSKIELTNALEKVEKFYKKESVLFEAHTGKKAEKEIDLEVGKRFNSVSEQLNYLRKTKKLSSISAKEYIEFAKGLPEELEKKIIEKVELVEINKMQQARNFGPRR